MRIILSRKGFDSSYGGMPSLITPKGGLISFPIPSKSEKDSYTHLRCNYDGGVLRMSEVMEMIRPSYKENGAWRMLSDSSTCHLDPDLSALAKQRVTGWRGSFGQTGAAQRVLMNAAIMPDDLFLFFGWFNSLHSSFSDYANTGKHLIFGYLQIGEIIRPAEDHIPAWLADHPHAARARRGDEVNCIYVARERSSWSDETLGYGILKYSDDLVLTKPGMTRSKWNLPDLFRGLDITYHSEASWCQDYFQSACRGQEFVVESNEVVTQWAIGLIENNKSS